MDVCITQAEEDERVDGHVVEAEERRSRAQNGKGGRWKEKEGGQKRRACTRGVGSGGGARAILQGKEDVLVRFNRAIRREFNT